MACLVSGHAGLQNILQCVGQTCLLIPSGLWISLRSCADPERLLQSSRQSSALAPLIHRLSDRLSDSLRTIGLCSPALVLDSHLPQSLYLFFRRGLAQPIDVEEARESIRMVGSGRPIPIESQGRG